MNLAEKTIREPNTFEVLRVLHILWLKQRLTTSQINTILKEDYELEYEIIGPKMMKVKSLDGLSTYKVFN